MNLPTDFNMTRYVTDWGIAFAENLDSNGLSVDQGVELADLLGQELESVAEERRAGQRSWERGGCMSVYTAADFEHGLRCAECGREFVEGQPISERLDAMDTLGPLAHVFGGDEAEALVWATLVCGGCLP